MSKIRKILGIFALFSMCLLNLPSMAKAEEINVSFNPVPYTYYRMPELSGTVDDPDAFVTVVVGSSFGVGANNPGNGTWYIPAGEYGPFEDGTYNVMVIAENFNTGGYTELTAVNALTIKDDYVAPPEIFMEDQIDGDNATSFSITGLMEFRNLFGSSNLEISDTFHSPITLFSFSDWNGNLDFGSTDITSLWDGPITIKAQAVDDSGNESKYTIKTIHKDTATLVTPVTNADSIIKQQNQSNFVISGNGFPNSEINYYFKDFSGIKKTGKCSIDGSGHFSAIVDLSSLADGNIVMYVSSRLGDQISKMTSTTLFKTTVGPEVYDVNIDTDRQADVFNLNMWGLTIPNCTLKYSFKAGDKNIEGEIVADENGDFNISDLDLHTLPDGEIVFTMSSINEFGNEGECITRIVIKETIADDGDTDEEDNPDPVVEPIASIDSRNGITVLATSIDEASDLLINNSLPVTGPNSMAVLILSGLALLAGILVRRLKIG